MEHRYVQRTHMQKQSGVSMIEVLVAVVIFAFGILAIAGLQLAALNYQKGAWSRAGSATVITDLAERMRANTLAARTGAYLLPGTYSSLLASPPAASGCDAKTTLCQPTQIAENDLSEWFNQLSQTLPGGVGSVRGSLATGFIVTAMWFDKNLVDTAGNLVTSQVCSTATAPRLNCCEAGTPAGVRCVNSIVLP